MIQGAFPGELSVLYPDTTALWEFWSFDQYVSNALSLCNWSPSKDRIFLIQRIVNVYGLLMCCRNEAYLHLIAKGSKAQWISLLMKAHLINKSLCQNLTITKIRLEVEHPCSFFNGMFHIDHVMTTTVQRVRVMTYIIAICYNLIKEELCDQTVLSEAIMRKSEKKVAKNPMILHCSDKLGWIHHVHKINCVKARVMGKTHMLLTIKLLILLWILRT